MGILKRSTAADYVLSFSMALIYVSAIFLSDTISYLFTASAPSFIYCCLMALLFGLAVVGRDRSISILKWAVSIPLAFGVISFFWNTDFAMNQYRYFTGFMRPSGGENFAGLVRLMVLSELCMLCGAIGCNIKPDDTEQFGKTQLKVIITADIVIALSVAVLLMRFSA